MALLTSVRHLRVLQFNANAALNCLKTTPVVYKKDLNQQLCKRCQSTILQTVDTALQLSPANPLYQFTHGVFDLVHTATGVPWWLSIIATTFCLRGVLLLPVMVAAQRNQAKLINLRSELKEEAASLSKAVKHAKWVHKLSTEQYMHSHKASLQKLHRDFYEKHNVHPFKSLVITATQLPVFVLVSLTLRNMSGYFGFLPQEGFTTEGGAWFTDLTTSDPMMALPLALGVVTLLSMRVGRMTSPAMSSLDQQSIRINRKMNITMLTLVIALVPLSATQPSALSLYWLTTASLSLLQNLAFSVPPVRRALGIMKTPNEPNISRLFERRS